MRLASLAVLLIAAPAWADVGEASLRPVAEVHFGQTTRPDGGQADVTGLGGGVLLSHGLTFSLAVTARYGFEAAGALRADRADGTAVEFTQQRHLALAGLAWAPSDQLTPVVLLEGGVAVRRQTDGFTLRPTGGGLEVDAFLPDATDVLPVARLTALLEWRVTDFVSLAGGGLAEYSDGRLGYGAQLMLGLYRYL